MKFNQIDKIYVDQDLIIRKIKKDDLEDLYVVYSDPEVMQYASEPVFNDLTLMDTFYASVLNGYETNEYVELAILFNSEVIGTCSIHSYDEQMKEIEIGYLLNRQHWGKGLMAKCLSKLIEYITNELDLIKVIADIDAENERSIKLVTKLGFEPYQSRFVKNIKR